MIEIKLKCIRLQKRERNKEWVTVGWRGQGSENLLSNIKAYKFSMIKACPFFILCLQLFSSISIIYLPYPLGFPCWWVDDAEDFLNLCDWTLEWVGGKWLNLFICFAQDEWNAASIWRFFPLYMFISLQSRLLHIASPLSALPPQHSSLSIALYLLSMIEWLALIKLINC